MSDNTGNCTVKEWAAALMESHETGFSGEISMIINGAKVNMVSTITHVNGRPTEMPGFEIGKWEGIRIIRST